MRQTNQPAGLLFAIFLFGVAAAACGPASGQPADPNQREVSLMRQDFSDCTNGNVSDQNPVLIGGTVWIIRDSGGLTRLKVAITAQPRTTYHFFLKCVRLLGDITTQEEGEAIATFEFQTNSTGNVYAFDVYPEGAPAGNKFQSDQVKLP